MRIRLRDWWGMAAGLWLGAVASTSIAMAAGAPIRLMVNPWPASALNVEVAKQLLEKELGREVMAVAVDENAQWEMLAKGEGEAVLELWPSGHREAWQRHVVERRDVTPGGPLGVRGQIAWYTTRATVEAHPAVASWKGLGSNGSAGIFAGPGREKGRLLTGDPSWTQFDAEIIGNLGLNLEVVPLGSEAALVKEVRRAAKAGEPLLFYFYTPHALFQELDLVQVELPRHDPDQWTKAGRGEAACAYPVEPLTKLFSPGLARADPGAAAFLRAMRYDNAAQLEMLAAVEAGRTPAEAAAAWIVTHAELWRGWVDAARAVDGGAGR